MIIETNKRLNIIIIRKGNAEILQEFMEQIVQSNKRNPLSDCLLLRIRSCVVQTTTGENESWIPWKKSS